MPRRSRLVVEGMPHHVTQRGNYCQNVFESRVDFQCYSYWIEKYAGKYNIDIIAYCLMTNHVHFIVIPRSKENLSLFLNMTHMRYSQYKNKKSKRTGHLWQGRFYSSVLDETHLLRAVRYVEQNPVRVNMVEDASDYIWSSAKVHLGLEENSIIRTIDVSGLMPDKDGWKDYLKQEDSVINNIIREKTKKGGVVATEEFISSIEQKFGIILHTKKAGRPKK